MTPDRFALASLVSTPDYLAKTGLTIDSVTASTSPAGPGTCSGCRSDDQPGDTHEVGQSQGYPRHVIP